MNIAGKSFGFQLNVYTRVERSQLQEAWQLWLELGVSHVLFIGFLAQYRVLAYS